MDSCLEAWPGWDKKTHISFYPDSVMRFFFLGVMQCLTLRLTSLTTCLHLHRPVAATLWVLMSFPAVLLRREWKPSPVDVPPPEPCPVTLILISYVWLFLKAFTLLPQMPKLISKTYYTLYESDLSCSLTGPVRFSSLVLSTPRSLTDLFWVVLWVVRLAHAECP